MKFNASNVQVSSPGGEYFQVLFSESDVENCPYILLQNSLEFFRGPAYFECHDLDLVGHGRVRRCELQRESLEIDVADSTEHITVTFDESQEKIANLAWILRIIVNRHVPFVNSSGISESPIEDPEF